MHGSLERDDEVMYFLENQLHELETYHDHTRLKGLVHPLDRAFFCLEVTVV